MCVHAYVCARVQTCMCTCPRMYTEAYTYPYPCPCQSRSPVEKRGVFATGGHRSQGEDFQRTECLSLTLGSTATCTKHFTSSSRVDHSPNNGNYIARAPVGRLGQQPFFLHLQCTNPGSPAGLELRHRLLNAHEHVLPRTSCLPFLAPPKIALILLPESPQSCEHQSRHRLLRSKLWPTMIMLRSSMICCGPQVKNWRSGYGFAGIENPQPAKSLSCTHHA